MRFPISMQSLLVARLCACIFLAVSLASCVSLHAAQRQVTLTCTPSPASVYPGDPVTVTASAKGLDPKLSAIYSWSPAGVVGNGASATVPTASLAAGIQTVTAVVKFGKRGKEGLNPGTTATCSARITIKGYAPPNIKCSVNARSIQSGGKATITSVAVSLENRPLTYSYSATAGTVSDSGTTAEFSSAGVPMGRVEITCKVSDDKGRVASAQTYVAITTP